MKVLIVTSPAVDLCEPYVGGTEAFVVSLANELVRRGHMVDVVARRTDEHNLFNLIEFRESPFAMAGTRYDEARGQQYFMTYQFGLMDLRSYDIVHYNTYETDLLAMAALHDIPSAVTLHLAPNEKLSIVYKLFCQRTSAVPISISQRISDSWQSILGATTIIHNGIDLDRWPFKDRKRDGFMLWSGRINGDKNPLAAIELARHTGRRLKLVGPIFDQHYFDHHIKPHLSDRIEYIGHVPQNQMSQLSAEASVYLATAEWQEPFGLSTVEMLASGLPVIGFTSAIPSELRHDGACIAVDSHDWHDLLKPLEASSSIDPLACHHYAEEFTTEKMAIAYEEQYTAIVSSFKNRAKI